MHHPKRHERLEALLPRLDKEVHVIEDPEPEGEPCPWRTARKAWYSGWELEQDWHMVLQDDILPCKDFIAGAWQACQARYGLLSFFCPPEVSGDAVGQCWLAADPMEWYGSLAVAMPSTWIETFLEWCAHSFDGTPWSDDDRIRRWARHQNLDIWCVIPTLVEHLDPGIGMGTPIGAGVRESRDFIGADRSALELDFSQVEPHRSLHFPSSRHIA